jgi:hypothetical protein
VRVRRIQALLGIRQIGNVPRQEFGRTRLEFILGQIFELLVGGPARVVVAQAHAATSGNLEQTTNLLERERHAILLERVEESGVAEQDCGHPECAWAPPTAHVFAAFANCRTNSVTHDHSRL